MASTITKFSHLLIPLEDVQKATNNFDAKNVIGHGGLGKVYKGKLLRSGKWMNIAARRLDTKHKLDIEFWTEISVLSTLKHENLVSIIGFCDEKGEKVIINSHEAKRSLSVYLSNPCLTWVQILKICVGVARALSYIHYEDGRSYSVIHRNINSSTILLDANFEPKLTGFEYSINHSVHQMDQVLFSEAIGTTGYMDPSIEKSGGVTHKSDIYSFGVVLFELLCGRKAFIPNEDNSFLAPLAIYHCENKTVDDTIQPGLMYQMGWYSVKKFLKIAYSCLNDARVLRPDMNYVVHELEEALELQLPYESLFTNNLEHLKFRLGDLKIRLADIKLATDNFSEVYRMRGTLFYDLYRAELELFAKENFASEEEKSNSELPKRRATVVIKRIRPREDKQGERAFFTAIEILTSCKHHNIVSLLGFCDEGFEKILVIERLSNGYLDDYLVNIKDEPIPTWAERLKICLNVAYGLHYLHYETEDQKMIIHRDIKCGTIALDENLGAKIVDLDLSLFLPQNQDDDALHLSWVCGTFGYVDPEFQKTGKLKRESDVYSFGVVLFEVLCGRVAHDPIYKKESEKGLAFVAQRRFHEGTLKEMIDPLIMKESNDNNCILTKGPNKDSLDIFVKIAYQCLTETQDRRPTMKFVIEELEKALSFQEQVQRQDINQMTNENLEESENAVESRLYRNMASTVTTFSHLQIPLEDVLKATNNFDAKNIIGRGGLGKVYKGKLLRSGKWMNIAARRMDTKHKLDIEFWTEISALSTLKHENLVSIIGFCDEKGEKVIINNHEAKRSLSIYLSNPCLTWIQRLKICVGVARALSYTRYEDGRSYSVIHRNINSSTILLDDNFEPKLSGFEYSINHSVHRMDQVLFSEAIGTTGYMDPSIEKSGGVTLKSDIYSFGVVLWEVLCGRKAFIPNEDNSFLAPLAKYHFGNCTVQDIIKFGLTYQMGWNSVEKFWLIANSCLNDAPVLRPDMNYVVHELEEALQLQLPYETTFTNNLEHLKFRLGDLKIRLADIKLATDNFSEAYRMWSTSFYDLYRAELQFFAKGNFASEEEKSNSELPKRRATVVIKRIRPREDKQGERVFFTEIEILTSCKHHNIVSLLGFCDEGFEKILVIEHLSNGYLDDYLVNIKNEPIPTWTERLKICLNVADGLHYLHYEMEDQKKVIHCHIESGTIALDKNLGAKIVEYDLSLFLPQNQDDDALRLYQIPGTPTHQDPELWKTGKLKRESDVYSFGVVLFEVLCGRVAHDPIYKKESEKGLAFVVQRRFHEGTLKEMIDPLIMEESNDNNCILTKKPNKDSLDIFVKIAYQCLTETQDRRPTMKSVIEELKKALSFQEQVQRQDINQVVYEFEKPLELKMTNANLEESENALESRLPNNLKGNILEHLRIRLSDIMLATDNFSQPYYMGDASFDVSFIAELGHFDEENCAFIEENNESKLPKRHTTAVVKRVLRTEDKQGEKAFFTEFEILTSCQHHNIVRLLGFCDEGLEKIIVVEHFPNGSLADYLLNIKDQPILTWAKRLKICVDVAHGLNYLHYEMEDQKVVIHFNIMSAVIKLDKNWGAKIVEFGYSKFLPPNQDKDALYPGEIFDIGCYGDPEYHRTGRLKRESDVYSFGVILLEILCGRVANDPMYLKESDKGLAYLAQRWFNDGTIKTVTSRIHLKT